ncbi:MAG: hypothetical protein CVU90_14050 [Firmicutes bacterium HGW-Firmicutes-15]|nr:MAG: hypothetical protein CVU90_14050 [Firmicutes bacterium HGW-Firmicutes-15]
MKGAITVKRNKIWIAVFCIAIMASTFSIPAFANSSDHLNISTPFNISAPGDTLNRTQEEYLAETKTAITQSNSDEQKIESICESFLTLAKASVRDPQSYDCTQLITTDSLKKATVQYRLTDYQYQSALNKALGWKITRDDLVFTDFKIQKKNKNYVEASVVESYTYNITDGFDGKSFRRKMYTFELLGGSDGWKITNVNTDDPWETDEGFEYKPIDVKTAVNAHLAENKLKYSTPSIDETKDVKADLQVSPTRTMYNWSYDFMDAVAYAEVHYSDTSNPVFGFTSGNNCQNFASQCVWAGLGGSGTDITARPAVSTSLVGTSAFNVWCRNQSTTYYSNYLFNWSWDNICGFFNLIQMSTSSTEGPYGISSYSNGVQNAIAGNVLGVDWNGSPASTTLDHAMFVTQVTGSGGSRTKDNVKIAAHTSATNSAYMTLSTYTTQPIGSFARSQVYRGYYTVPQP